MFRVSYQLVEACEGPINTVNNSTLLKKAELTTASPPIHSLGCVLFYISPAESTEASAVHALSENVFVFAVRCVSILGQWNGIFQFPLFQRFFSPCY